MRFSAGSSFSHGDQTVHWWKSSMRGKIVSGGAAIVIERSTEKRSGFIDTTISRMTASTSKAKKIQIPMSAPSVDYCFSGALPIMIGVPNLSTSIPNPGDQNVAPKGMFTVPPSDSASNARLPSSTLRNPSET